MLMPNDHLPEKTCAVCGRPFKWRKKWERDWASVRHCSKRCVAEARRQRRTTAAEASSHDDVEEHRQDGQ